MIHRAFVIACLIVTSGCASMPQEVSDKAYGKEFVHSIKDGQPLDGHVVYRAASDYYWVTEYSNARVVGQKSYLVDQKTGEHKLFQVYGSDAAEWEASS
jgi:hypothetical protein